MKRMKHNFLNQILYLSALILCISIASCNNGESQDNGDKDITEAVIDSNKTGVINVGGELFSIPSPIQTVMLIKKSGAKYLQNELSNTANVSNYTSKNQKALNLGVFGADLGYATAFSDNQSAVKSLNAIEQLSKDLDITGAFNKDLIKRLGSNANNQDSMLVLSSVFYRAADTYLKDNNRYDVGAMILAGGWIEGLYFTSLSASEGNEAAKQRLGEQKVALENLISLISAQEKSPELEVLLTNLKAMNETYSKLESVYTFQRPETNEEKKITTIKSTTTNKITDQQLQEIIAKLKSLRTTIIG
jgi:hypothetical protein